MMFKPFMNLFPYLPPKENLLGKKIQELNKQDSIILYCLGSLFSDLILGGCHLALQSPWGKVEKFTGLTGGAGWGRGHWKNLGGEMGLSVFLA